MSCTSASTSICPCETFAFPQVIYNPAGLTSIRYRVGDYVGFREALLQALPGETELTRQVDDQVIQVWRPGASGDLAVQMIEWWAYLSDVLTFYNERIANQAYLGTADLAESVSRLIQILGYRPQPALGSSGKLAALLNGTRPVTLPQGFQIQSKPGPGQKPQVFELDATTTVRKPDVLSVLTVPTSLPLFPAGNPGWLWLAGKVSGIKAGEKLLLVNAKALNNNAVSSYALLSVLRSSSQTDPVGNPVTQVSYQTLASGPGSAGPGASSQAADYVLLRSSQSMLLWSYPNSPTVISPGTPATADLVGLARGVAPGDVVLFEVTGSPTGDTLPVTTATTVQSYSEEVWYANGWEASPPVESPPGSIPAVSIPHSHVTVVSLPDGDWNANASLITFRWNWSRVGQLAPVVTAQDLAYSGDGSTSLVAAGAAPTPETPVLLEDANGNGATADATIASGGSITLTNPSTLPSQGLAAPIDVFLDVLQVSRGKTVSNEVLGSGNPQVAGQDFTLQQSPVTYRSDPAAISGDRYSSTVAVAVNGVLWTEVRSFYQQDSNAQVFVTREDEQGQTHVVFGDGANGARLPSGVNNVVVTYRYGAGGQAPDPETLTVVLNPQPGLKSVRNPVPPTGGADADSPTRIRKLAPQSVMTFGRAVSLDDYQVLAATAPGVVQATASYVFDPISQRARVTLWVSGQRGIPDSEIIASVQTALLGAADPNRPPAINVAQPVEAVIGLTYVRDKRYDDSAVQAGIIGALLDPDNGLLGVNVVGIGQIYYNSQINAACLKVPGVTAIHGLTLTPTLPTLYLRNFLMRSDVRLLRRQSCTDEQHNPGDGRYFWIPNDNQHLNLSGSVAP